MRKQMIAFVVALSITGIVALTMLIVGVNAAVNPNSVPVSNSPAQAALQGVTNSTSVTTSGSPQAQIAQLQAEISQYQTALQSAQTQLNQASQEMQTVQQLLTYLQQRGIIRIDSQGNITVLRGRDGFGG